MKKPNFDKFLLEIIDSVKQFGVDQRGYDLNKALSKLKVKQNELQLIRETSIDVGQQCFLGCGIDLPADKAVSIAKNLVKNFKDKNGKA
jgi:hypothetical protein